MKTFANRAPRLIVLVMAMVALLASAAPAPAAAQVNGATWAAWGLAVNFPQGLLEVKFVTYVGKNSPAPEVLGATIRDISGDCIIRGNLIIQDGYAVFGGNGYIECQIPSWRAEVYNLAPYLSIAKNSVVTCSAGGSPFWVSADITLDPVPSGNPVLDASQVGSAFSLPSNGTDAKIKLIRSSGEYLSPAWKIDTTAGNRMLVGQNGPAAVEVIDHFKAVDYLSDPGWINYFQNQVTGTYMGHWVESPSSASKRSMPNNFDLMTDQATIYIGYNSATGEKLHGTLRALRKDPGCKGS